MVRNLPLSFQNDKNFGEELSFNNNSNLEILQENSSCVHMARLAIGHSRQVPSGAIAIVFPELKRTHHMVVK